MKIIIPELGCFKAFLLLLKPSKSTNQLRLTISFPPGTPCLTRKAWGERDAARASCLGRQHGWGMISMRIFQLCYDYQRVLKKY